MCSTLLSEWADDAARHSVGFVFHVGLRPVRSERVEPRHEVAGRGATIDGKINPRAVTTGIASEELDRIDDALQRHRARDAAVVVVGKRLAYEAGDLVHPGHIHLRVAARGADGVDTDAVAAEFKGGGLGHSA